MNRYLVSKQFSTNNPFKGSAHKNLNIGGKAYNYWNVNTLGNDISKKIIFIF